MKPMLKPSRTRSPSKPSEVGLWRSVWQHQGVWNRRDEETRSFWRKELLCEVMEAAGKFPSFLEEARAGLLQGEVEVEVEVELAMGRTAAGTLRNEVYNLWGLRVMAVDVVGVEAEASSVEEGEAEGVLKRSNEGSFVITAFSVD